MQSAEPNEHHLSLSKASLRQRAMSALLVCSMALLMFCVVWIAQTPLSQHEARLPQLAREMIQTGHWQWPTSGGRPWTERPPLAQWLTAGVFLLTGQTNSEAVARILPVLCGVVVCWMYAGIAFRVSGNLRIGLLAGLAVATTYQVMTYATIAEDEIVLAMVNAVALRLFIEAYMGSSRVLCSIAFFTLLGIGCWLRGLMVGMAQVGSGVGTFLILQSVFYKVAQVSDLWDNTGQETGATGSANSSPQFGSITTRLKHLFAPWGVLVWIIGLAFSLAIGWSWWLYTGSRVPLFWENFRYDISSGWGREPWWHYLPALSWVTQPWTIPMLVGIVVAIRKRWWFVLAIAIAPVVLMSIPERKNHHYLVPVIGAWSVLGAIGMSAIWRWGVSLNSPRRQILTSYAVVGVVIAVGIVVLGRSEMPLVPVAVLVGVGVGNALCVLAIGDAVAARSPVRAAIAFFLAVWIGSSFVHLCYTSGNPKRLADRAFAREVEQLVPPNATLLIAQKEALDFFMLQYWLRPDAKLLHNITWVKDESIKSSEIYVVTRAFDRPYLQTVGSVEEIVRADYSRREKNPDWRWALFKLTYRQDVDRHPRPEVNALQGLRRPDPNDESPYMGERPPPYDPVLKDGAK
jgi:4-amino-4-deoxy-L-arabinose transferase-like glycosyltransferase